MVNYSNFKHTMSTQHRIYCLSLAAIVLFGIGSCNIYRPLDPAKSDEGYLEEGLRCYHLKDYDCAVAAFEKLSDSDTKTEKLCMGYLAQAGLTLDLLLNVVNQANSTMLGQLATALLPWSSGKETASQNASAKCLMYATTGTASDVKTLLNYVAQMVDCSTRLARTDTFGDKASDCTASHTPVTSGEITDGDVDFMCAADAEACADNIATISSSQLGTSGLGSLKSALDLFPAELKSAASVAATVRTALKTVVKD